MFWLRVGIESLADMEKPEQARDELIQVVGPIAG